MFVCVLCTAAGAVLQATRHTSGIAEDTFLDRKLSWRAAFDTLLAGDSRMEEGVSPAEVQACMPGRRVGNLAFRGAGWEVRYLDAIDRALDPASRCRTDAGVLLGRSRGLRSVEVSSPGTSSASSRSFRPAAASNWGPPNPRCDMLHEMVSARLPPTSSFAEDDALPYFLWWTHVTTGEFRQLIKNPETKTRAYWIGSLLREANTRDVWSFVTPEELRGLWPSLVRHLGRKRGMWAFLLGLPAPVWPPAEAGHG